MNLYVNNQIDYGSGSFVVTTDSELTRMNQEELTFRSYYRMMQKLDRCNEEEQLYRQKLYEQALCQNHVIPGAPIQNMTAESIGMTGSLAMLKRSRYFPPFLYQQENFEMFYIHSGQCTHICKGQEYLLKQGDFCLLEYGVPHCIVNHSDACIVLELTAKRELMDRLCARLFREDTVLSRFFKSALYEQTNYPMLVFHTGSHPPVQYYIYAMYHEFQRRLPHYEVMMEAFLNALFAILLWCFRPQQEQPIPPGQSPLSPVLAYMHEHHASVTLKELSHIFGYSSSHLGKLISSTTGLSFTELLRQIRLRRATELLKSTGLSITQIASEVGYADTAHFSRSFRQEFNLPPSEYRQLFAIREE